jgi:predicted nucleic acid-binding Zn finger protein
MSKPKSGLFSGTIGQRILHFFIKNEKRLIPGKEGHVAGGNPNALGKNLLHSMNVPTKAKRGNYQAQHIIPVNVAKTHPIIKKIGMEIDHANNGIFLRIPDNSSSVNSRHLGYHSTYNNFVRSQLDKIDINRPVKQIIREVYHLQQNLTKLLRSGLPMYPSQGATEALWTKHLKRITK